MQATDLPPPPPTAGANVAPLWCVLVFTFLGSLGTGTITNGVYLLAESAYGFGAVRNAGLGLLFGVVYIAGAVAAGPTLKALHTRAGWSTRRCFALIVALSGAVCVLPPVANAIPTLRGTGSWPIWLTAAIYGPLSGMLWPVCESYLSGGRRGRALRRAIGRFNIVWALAIPMAFWLMTPIIKHNPLVAMTAVAVLHAGLLVLMPCFPAEPGRHDETAPADEPITADYPVLLRDFRRLLVIAYVLMATLGPQMPTLLERLGVPLTWKPALWSVLYTVRMAAFVVFERWHGWHGRRMAAAAGLGLLIVGFGGAMLTPTLGGGTGVGLLVVSLGVLGVGVALVYVGALYYAMSVGSASVDSGGAHEALIGIGYAVGPGCGLIAATLIVPTDGAYPAVTVGLAVGACIIIGIWTGIVMRRPS